MISDIPTQFAYALEAGHAGSRQSGRTTAMALFAIAWAMANPRKPAEIREQPNTLPHREHMATRVMEIITRSGLRGFTLTRGSKAIFLEFDPSKILTASPINADSALRSTT